MSPYIQLRKVAILVSVWLFCCSLTAQSQSFNKKIQKAWIRIESVDLSPAAQAPDTNYARYTFGNKDVHISFYPAWSDFSFLWSLTNHSLTIGIETYLLEELTDSTLVFYKENFRRTRFVSETLYSKRTKPATTRPFHDQVVYVASNYLTPRYKKEKSLQTTIGSLLEKAYSVNHKITFLARFIVTTQGRIDRVEIVNGISPEFDNEFIKQIGKTSGDWYPAKIDNMPVNCEMTYTIKYLDSIVPYETLKGKR
ncbi:hypothetical protein [Chitinophaga sp. MM2321]|uniref:energy transducer TonB n=1 Tax=Chitinophaga sp. MM2321 TaxID=3137178 RepID=UPI0032D5899E